MPKYQINATIKKPGGGPVKWTHYSDFPMSAEECRKNFSKEKEAGKCFSVDVHISDFRFHLQRNTSTVMNWERINHD